MSAPRRHWRPTALIFFLVLSATVVATGAGSDIAGGVDSWLAEQGDEEDLDAREIETLIHERVNNERQAEGLNTLAYDSELAEIARGHSSHMAEDAFYAHETPSGEDFQDRYKDAGYACRIPIGGDRYAVGSENLGSTYAYIMVEADNGSTMYDTNQEVADAIVDSWMDSQPHRENLLKPYWNNEGIGVALAEREEDSGVRVYVTQNFC